ncbi:hypothetical protein EEDFHM_02100 [Methylorubrum populi]
MRLDAYRHIRRGAWSVRRSSRVVGHVPTLILADVRFVVRQAARRRIVRTMQREVCAHVQGIPTDAARPLEARRVRFSPYAGPAFTLEDGTPIAAAALVFLGVDGACWAVMGDVECVR